MLPLSYGHPSSYFFCLYWFDPETKGGTVSGVGSWIIDFDASVVDEHAMAHVMIPRSSILATFTLPGRDLLALLNI